MSTDTEFETEVRSFFQQLEIETAEQRKEFTRPFKLPEIDKREAVEQYEICRTGSSDETPAIGGTHAGLERTAC